MRDGDRAPGPAPAPAPCAGTLWLASGSKYLSQTVEYSLPAAANRTVTLKLMSAARKQLRTRKLSVRVVIDGKRRARTFTLKKT